MCAFTHARSYIVTDNSDTLIHAVETAFPASSHQLCWVHAQKNAALHIAMHVRDDENKKLVRAPGHCI